MFLLHCKEDDSLLICDESDVIFEDNVKKGDIVQFIYKEKIYLGLIIERSENEKELETRLTELRAENKQKKTEQCASQSLLSVEGKRHSVKNKKYKQDYILQPRQKKKPYKKMQVKKKMKESEHQVRTKQTQLHKIMDVDSLESPPISSSDSERLSSRKQQNKIQDSQSTVESIKLYKSLEDKSLSKMCNETSSLTNEMSLENAIQIISTLQAKICELEGKQDAVPLSSSNDNVVTIPANLFHKESNATIFDSDDKENIDRSLLSGAVPSTSKNECVISPKSFSTSMKELQTKKESMYYGKIHCLSQHLKSRSERISLPCDIHESDAIPSTLSRTSSSATLKSDLFSKTLTPCQTSTSADDVLSSGDNCDDASSDTDRYNSSLNQDVETNVHKNNERETLQETLQEGIIYETRQEYQLYGKNWPDETMILLCDEIYCRQSVLLTTLGHACKSSHIVRRLIQGVFKIEAIMNATVTGQAPRTVAHDKSVQIVPLDGKAKMAIIKYAQRVAEVRRWGKQSTKMLCHVMTQRLVELKKEYRK